MKRTRFWTSVAMCGTMLAGACLTGSAMADLKVGDDAPDFEMVGSDGKTYRLADFVGKQAVVMAWFPKAFTGG